MCFCPELTRPANAESIAPSTSTLTYPVIGTLKLKLKSSGPYQPARFIPDLLALSKPAVRKCYAATVFHALSGDSTTTESHSAAYTRSTSPMEVIRLCLH